MQLATGTSKPLWEWFEEKITVKDVLDGNTGPDGRSSGYPGVFGSELEAAVRGKNTNELIPRPEISNFGLAMIGGGRVHTEAHLYGKRDRPLLISFRLIKFRFPVADTRAIHFCRCRWRGW